MRARKKGEGIPVYFPGRDKEGWGYLPKEVNSLRARPGQLQNSGWAEVTKGWVLEEHEMHGGGGVHIPIS